MTVMTRPWPNECSSTKGWPVRFAFAHTVAPGEIAQASRLQVSRPTLRGALEVLRREGFIHTTPGRGTRIKQTRRETASEKLRAVAVLTAVPHHRLNSFSLFLLGKLQVATQSAGRQLELHCQPRLEFTRSPRSLERLVRHFPASCWVLLSTTPSVVNLFPEKKLPSLAVGAGVSNAGLPCIDIDHHATCQHAVMLLRSRGISRIALIAPRDVMPVSNDRAAPWRDAFLDASRGSENRARVFDLDFREWGVQRTLDRVFVAFPPPVGLLVVRPKHTLAIMSHLMHAGMHLPHDVSLISLGYESFLDFITPSVAHYRSDWDLFARRLCRMTLQLATEQSLPSRPVLLKSGFHAGDSLPPAR